LWEGQGISDLSGKQNAGVLYPWIDVERRRFQGFDDDTTVKLGWI
jgi:hypothetical protein